MLPNIRVITNDPYCSTNFCANSYTDAQSKKDSVLTIWEPLWRQIQNPQHYSTALNICPKCTKLVFQSQQALICSNSFNRSYLAHHDCASQVYKFTECTRTAKILENKNKIVQVPTIVQGHSYLVLITFQHPLTNVQLFSFSGKIQQNERRIIYINKNSQQNSFEANFIVLPLCQFKCNIKIKPLFSSKYFSSQEIMFRVDLRQKKTGVYHICAQQQFIFTGEFQIVEETIQKKQIIDQMKFKYERCYQKQSFVVFNCFLIQLRDPEKQLNLSFTRSAGKIQQKNLREQSFQIQGTRKNTNQINYLQEQNEKHESQIQHSQFINLIKTQNGSKEMQKKVKSFKNQQIQNIISEISPHIKQVILDEYANYMFQSLISVCKYQQRVKILERVRQMLFQLVCTQQGTFVFQQFLSFLTNKDQFEIICTSVLPHFKQICIDNYGNHFMRKLIQNISKQSLGMFLPNVFSYFCEFAKDKNGVCVMKCILRALKQGAILNTETQSSVQLKKFIDNLTLNTQQLINDEFGNYLIQQAYQIFQCERLQGISEFIIKFFVSCSCEKFASNVISNCVKKYWRKTPVKYDALRQIVDHKNICFMYQNKNGNRILLDIMELNFQIAIKDKISSVVQNEGPSIFNNRRWVNITGKSKTGAVGTNFISFSQAHNFTKRKHDN